MFFLSRWHPELALRYLPMVKAIKESGSKTVAEIGSGGLGIAPYLKQPVIGIDLTFEPPFYPSLIPVVGTGTNVPLPENGIEASVCSDMLEHVSQEVRQSVITELFRISTKCIVIGVPAGEGAHLQDQQLDREYEKVHGTRHHFLAEQTEYGVPTVDDITAMIKKAADAYAKKYDLHIIPNTNLSLRLFLMRGWISKNIVVNIFHRKLLLLALPFLIPTAHTPPTYRQIFVISLKSD